MIEDIKRRLVSISNSIDEALESEERDIILDAAHEAMHRLEDLLDEEDWLDDDEDEEDWDDEDDDEDF